MSNIIQLSDLEDQKKTWQYLQGKATKQFVLEEASRIDKDIEMIGEELKRATVAFGQLFSIQKSLGLQMETLVRMLDAAVPDFRQNFGTEYERSAALSAFAETLNNEGSNAAKPMKEKIDICRDWNKEKQNIRIKGMFFGLPSYILQHLDEFTEEEVELLAIEFDCPEVFEQFKNAKLVSSPDFAEVAS